MALTLAKDAGASSDAADATGLECAGGIHIHAPSPSSAQDLRRADQFIPFCPDTFLDELVQMFAVTGAGEPLSATQFRAMPPELKASLVAGFLQLFGGADDAAPARAPLESDAAYLLRAWRENKTRDDAAPNWPAAARQRLAAVPAPIIPAPVATTALTQSPGVNAGDAVSGGQDAPAHDIAAPMPIAPAPRSRRGSRAHTLAMTAILLALAAIAAIAASALLFLQQNSANQSMIQAMQKQQNALMEATRANNAAITSLAAALRHAAPSSSSAAAPDRKFGAAQSAEAKAPAPPIGAHPHLRGSATHAALAARAEREARYGYPWLVPRRPGNTQAAPHAD